MQVEAEHVQLMYPNKGMERLFADPRLAIKKLGRDIAKKLYLRKDQLEAADCLKILLDGKIGRCHPLHHEFEGMFGLDLKDQIRLIIKPYGNDACIDYAECILCEHVEIVGVVDYHGKKNEWLFR